MRSARESRQRRASRGIAAGSQPEILVQKFGGTSVASLAHIARAAERITAAQAAGFAVVVVVSAMSGETERLLSLARQVTVLPDLREVDVLVSSGEQVTAALTALTLTAMGRKARSFLGHQVKITTDSNHGDAQIGRVDRARILDALGAGEIAVIAGFQGVDTGGNITTLGRGGSDTTAVAVAAALQAEVCEIYTDVDGIYTADPAVCVEARRLSRVSYPQMLAFSSLGAKVLNHRSVALGMKYGTPIHVRSSFSREPGTWVVDDQQTQVGTALTGIAQDKSLASIHLVSQDRQESALIAAALAGEGVQLERMAPDGPAGEALLSPTFVIRKADVDRALDIIAAKKRESTQVNTDLDVVKVSVVGASLHRDLSLAARIHRGLGERSGPSRPLSRTETSISFLVAAADADQGICALHQELGLSAPEPCSPALTHPVLERPSSRLPSQARAGAVERP